MIDSHCHLDVAIFDPDRSDVLARAAARGVKELVLPAVDEASWGPILAFATIPGPVKCHAALGIHPVALPGMREDDDARVLAALETRARATRPVAIGECGLDTSIDLAKAPLERQERVLLAQLGIAIRLELPVILHARGSRCYELLLAFLESHPLPARGGVLHSYGGGIDFLKRYLALRLMFGFAGPATYPTARKVRTSIQAVPDDRLLAETDAPDQCPEPHRPGRSEPAYVADVIAGIAAARMQTIAEVAELTSGNARRLFGLA